MKTTHNRPILIVGFGSVGRRHIRNLKSLGYNNFVLYRTGKSTLPDEEIADILTENSLEKALSHQPVATIIANPTALHMSVALAALGAGSHIFLEKPISHNLEGVEALRSLAIKKGLVVSVGFQFRFHPGLRKMKRLLEKNAIGKVVSVQSHWGEYLPLFHPWEDYHKSYSAQEKLGGGVLLTLCHPFDYLRWMIGEVDSVLALESRSGGLDIDVEDSADVLLHFTSGVVGNVHLDYLQQPTEHFVRIVGTSGTIHWNNSEPKNFDRNLLFIEEMRNFLSCIKGKSKPFCTLDDGVATLQIVLAAKQSAKKKRLIKLK